MKHFRKVLFFGLMVFLMMLGVGNVKAQAAKSPYYIKVNKGTNVVTVYKNNGKAHKAFICSTGKDTPTGTFYTPVKYRWRALMGPSYGQYSTRIVGGILFHSVWYYENGENDTMSTREYNKLGTTCSHGCVRLTCADAKWIYDNCPLKTKVIIFNGTSKDDPLGKPTFMKVSTKSKMGWDPTDPSKKNPYLNISFKGVPSSKKVEVNTTVPVLKGVTAKNGRNDDFTKKISVTVKKPGSAKYVKVTSQSMKLNKLGKYTFAYRVTDTKNNKTATKSVTYTVADTKGPAFTGIIGSKTVKYGTSMNIKSAVKAKSGTGADCTKTMTITVKKPGDKKASKFTGTTLKFNKLGQYIVTYKAYNKTSKKYSVKTVTYTCKDTTKPVLYGLKNSTKEYGSTYNVKTGVSAKSPLMGTNLTSKISVEVKDPDGKKVTVKSNKFKLDKLGSYSVRYTVKNASNVCLIKTIYVTAKDTKNPVITAPDILYADEDDVVNVLTDVSAKTAARQNITSRVTVSVVDCDGKDVDVTDGKFVVKKESYTVTYKVVGYNGKSVTKKAVIKVTMKPVVETESGNASKVE